MSGRWASRFVLVLVWLLAPGMLPADEPPALTAAEQQLLRDAANLNAEGVVLYGLGKLAAATDRLRKALELYQQVYSRDRYPDGHPDLAHSLSNVGLVLHQQEKYGQAEPFLRRAVAMYQALYPKDRYPDGHRLLALSLGNLGAVLQAQGEYGKAEPFARQALAMNQALYPKEKYPDGHPLLAAGLYNLGVVLKARREYARAEPFYRQALAMNQTLYPKALYPDGHPTLAMSLHHLGALLRDQGEYGRAEPFLRQALEMYQALYPKARYPDGHPVLASSLNSLGAVLWEQGAYDRAEPLYRQALAMRQALYPRNKYPDGHPDLATSLNDLGLLLHNQGEYDRAEPFLRGALHMNQSLYPKARYPDGHPDLVASLGNVARLLQDQKAYDRAELLARQALEMAQALYPKDRYPNGHPDLGYSLNKLSTLFMAQGEYGKAEPFARRALEMAQALHPQDRYPDGHAHLATSLNNLGFVLWAQGEDGRAEPFLRQGLEMRQALYPRSRYPDGHPDLATSLINLGTLLSARGEYDRAEPFARRALEQYTRQADRLARVAPEPVALNAAATFPRSRDLLLSVTRARADADARTYEAVWHSKASITRVYRRRHLAVLAAATDPAVRHDWDQLQQLRRRRAQLILAPASDGAGRREQIDQLNQEIGKVEQALQTRVPVLPSDEELAKLGPDALRQRLAPDTILVDLVRYTCFDYDPNRPGIQGEKRTVRYLAFVLSRADVRRVELGPAADLEEAVQRWRQTIMLKVPAGNDTARREHEAQLLRHGRRLRDLVWEPLEKRFPAGVRSVYLAPDGELTQLPWAALPGGGPDRVLLDDYALAVVPRAPFLLEHLVPPPARAAQRPPAPEGLLLVGGIRYDVQPMAAVAATQGAEEAVAQPVTWKFLPGAEAERRLLEGLLQKAGPKVTASLGGAEASAARLRQELEGVRYAHVATHGFFADPQFRSVLQLDPKLFERRWSPEGYLGELRGEGVRSPLVLSGLVCAGANRPDTPERGILSGDAIAGLLLDDLQLAVLSACDTGLGDVAGGEGVFGLQRAFHLAGCKNVVASLWKVDDAATAALMARFYGHLFDPDEARRLPPVEALRRAQLDLYRHPELIPAWSRGEGRAPGKPRPATEPPPADAPPELVTSAGRAPIRLWAAFILSGLGR
jgi:CHAT domain-containing protein/tetratricopeptide (TPR) repeat protein